MQRISFHAIGIDQGNLTLFSDFEDDGDMWTGTGPRECRRTVSFSERYADVPQVTLQMSMVDMSNEAFIRADLQAENVTKTDFDIVFRTWGDSRVARIRVAWQAIGGLPDEDDWDI